MSPGELTKAVAAATLISEATVTAHARMLREAGLLTTGARGVNAPEMTPLDAARLLLSVMVTERPSRAVDAVRDFGALPCVHIRRRDAELTLERYSSGLPERHAFENGIETLISIYAFEEEDYFFKTGKLIVGDFRDLPECEIKIKIVRLGAEIIVPGAQYTYGEPTPEFPPAPPEAEDEVFEQWLAQSGYIRGELDRRQKLIEKYNRSRIYVEKVIGTETIASLSFSFDRDKKAR